MGEKTLKIKLNAVYFIIFGSLASYYPFLTVYFGEKGLSYTQIGIAYAVNSLVAVISQPVWGYFTDKYSYKKKTIVISALGSAIAIYGFVFAKGFYFVTFSIILFMIFQSPVCSVSDAYCYEIIEQHRNIQYGRIRLYGSVGYAILALFLGELIKNTSINSTFVTYSIATVAGVIILLSIHFKDKQSESRLDFKDIGELFKNKRFAIFIISIVIINIALGVNGSYISILIEKTGGDVSKLGQLWFIVALSELPLLFIGNKLIKRYGELNIYMISLAIYILRYLLDSLAASYNAVILIQIMQSITFTLYLLSSLQYLNHIVPRKMRATGITIFSAIGTGIGGFIGNIGGGVLLEYISIFWLFRLLAVVSLSSLVIAAVLKRYQNKSSAAGKIVNI